MAYINLLEIVYPVGSVYITTLNTSPAELVGGTWEEIGRPSGDYKYCGLLTGTPQEKIGTYYGSERIEKEQVPNHWHPLSAPDNNPQGFYRTLCFYPSNGIKGDNTVWGFPSDSNMKWNEASYEELNTQACYAANRVDGRPIDELPKYFVPYGYCVHIYKRTA